MRFIFMILEYAFGNGTSLPLETEKIDKHIAELRKFDWFEEIYQRPEYHRLFFVRKKVRIYLQSSWRTRRLQKKVDARRRFIEFLNQELKESNRGI